MSTILLDSRLDSAGLGEAQVLLQPMLEEGEILLSRFPGWNAPEKEWRSLVQEAVKDLYFQGRYGSDWQMFVLVDLYPFSGRGLPIRLRQQLETLRDRYLEPLRNDYGISPAHVHVLASNAHDNLHHAKMNSVALARDLDKLGYSMSGLVSGERKGFVTHANLESIDQLVSWDSAPPYRRDQSMEAQSDDFRKWFERTIEESTKRCREVLVDFLEDLSNETEISAPKELVRAVPDQIRKEFYQKAGNSLTALVNSDKSAVFLPGKLMAEVLENEFSVRALLGRMPRVSVLILECPGHAVKQRFSLACAVIALSKLPINVQHKIGEDQRTGGLFDLELVLDDGRLEVLMKGLAAYYHRLAEIEFVTDIHFDHPEVSSSDFCNVSLDVDKPKDCRLNAPEFNLGRKKEIEKWNEWVVRLETEIEVNGYDGAVRAAKVAREKQGRSLPPVKEKNLSDSSERSELEEELKRTNETLRADIDVLKKSEVKRDKTWKSRLLFPARRRYLARRERLATKRQALYFNLVLGGVFLVVALTPPLADGNMVTLDEVAGLLLPLVLFITTLYFVRRAHKARVDLFRRDAERPLRKLIISTAPRNPSPLEAFRQKLAERLKLLCRLYWNRHKVLAIEAALVRFDEEQKAFQRQASAYKDWSNRSTEIHSRVYQAQPVAEEARGLVAEIPSDLRGWSVWQRLLGRAEFKTDVTILETAVNAPVTLPLPIQTLSLTEARVFRENRGDRYQAGAAD